MIALAIFNLLLGGGIVAYWVVNWDKIQEQNKRSELTKVFNDNILISGIMMVVLGIWMLIDLL